MQTTIDSNLRVFLVRPQGYNVRDVFCNLDEIPKVIETAFDQQRDKIVFYHYWDRKFKRISKKELNQLFNCNQIDYQIK